MRVGSELVNNLQTSQTERSPELPQHSRMQKMMEQVFNRAVPNVDAFAEEVGVSRATLYAWRNGKRNPTPENLAKLADAIERRGGELQALADELRKAAGS